MRQQPKILFYLSFGGVNVTDCVVLSPPNRLIKHTKKLMDKEEKLCIKILQTLREMLDKKDCIQESVSTWSALPSEKNLLSLNPSEIPVADNLSCRFIALKHILIRGN